MPAAAGALAPLAAALLLCGAFPAHAQTSVTSPAGPTVGPASEREPDVDPGDAPAVTVGDDPCLPEPPPGAADDPKWIDRMEQRLRLGGCRSARWIDGLFGQTQDHDEYRRVSGNVAPSVLWTEYDRFKSRVRFRVDLPLPQMDGRLRAFVGRFDREEFVTERAEASGALPRQFGTIGEEQTLLGLGYHPPGNSREGFDASAGIRVSSPLDPYVKASYRWVWPVGPDAEFRLRPIAFWQQSEQFGATLRADYDRSLSPDWFTRLTASTTYSGQSLGYRGYANATLFHRLSDRQAMALQVGLDGETEAEVPLREYGVRATYRQNVWRDWLVVEFRTSLTWPREREEEPRKPSWGAGVGFEMVFGPGTFRGSD